MIRKCKLSFLILCLVFGNVYAQKVKHHSSEHAVIATSSLKVGDKYMGGFVFYIDSTGKHGLIAAAKDLKPYLPWGCNGNQMSASGVGVGWGFQNTLLINEKCKEDLTAAAYCKNYTDSMGNKNWHLPSIMELSLMYTNLFRKGIGNFSPEAYWSSTELDAQYAWTEYFENADKNVVGKNINLKVRPVKNF